MNRILKNWKTLNFFSCSKQFFHPISFLFRQLPTYMQTVDLAKDFYLFIMFIDRLPTMGRCFITSASLAPCLFLFSYWVGYNWIQIFRSVETDLGRLTLVVAVINGCVYPFLVFSDLTSLSPWGTRIARSFLVALCHLIVRRLKLEAATKSLLHQQVKILE